MRAALTIVCLLGGTAAAGPTAHDVATSVKTYYASVPHLTAQFTEDVHNATFGQSKSVSGTVYLQRPGRMRWDYTGAKKTIVADGKRLWVVDVGNKELIDKSLRGTTLPAAVTFLYGKGDLEKDNTVALDASGALVLTPKQASTAYAQVVLVVDASGQVTESTVTDGAGNTSHYAFTGVDTTTALDKKLFQVDPKKKAFASYRHVHA